MSNTFPPAAPHDSAASSSGEPDGLPGWIDAEEHGAICIGIERKYVGAFGPDEQRALAARQRDEDRRIADVVIGSQLFGAGLAALGTVAAAHEQIVFGCAA